MQRSIKRYKRKTTDLIEQLEQSVQRNEVLITSRKKAVHTITHELRTPLTAITGYTGLLRKETLMRINPGSISKIYSIPLTVCGKCLTLWLLPPGQRQGKTQSVHPAGFHQ